MRTLIKVSLIAAAMAFFAGTVQAQPDVGNPANGGQTDATYGKSNGQTSSKRMTKHSKKRHAQRAGGSSSTKQQ